MWKSRTGKAMAAVLLPVALFSWRPSADGNVRTPVADGTVTYRNGRALVDASHTEDGYVMIRYSQKPGRVKIQITKSSTYTYDLHVSDAYEVFPLTEGDGTYSIRLFEHVSGNQYAQVFSQRIQVSLRDEFAPFLMPNQYVNFLEGSAVVKKAAELVAAAPDEISAVGKIYHFVVRNLSYDTVRAATVQSGYLPDIDQVLEQKKGICFDYAALMTAMLRSQNIPARLVIGYSGELYHAWVSVYTERAGWIDDMIYFDGHSWSLMDPAFASSGGQSDQVKQYIADEANYQAKYTY